MALSASYAAALEGRPPLLPDNGEDHSSPVEADAQKKRPMLIIRGKDGRILDVHGQGLHPGSSGVAPPHSGENK